MGIWIWWILQTMGIWILGKKEELYLTLQVASLSLPILSWVPLTRVPEQMVGLHIYPDI